MGGSSSQVTGYKYYSCAVVAIGLPIEDFLGINVDKRGWTWGSHVPMSFNDNGVNYKYGVNVSINEPNMFGKDEGGMVGTIRAYFGTQEQLPDPNYSRYLVSKGLPPVAYQGSLSYLVFAATPSAMEKPNDIQQWVNELKNGSVGRNSFYWGNSGLVKEMQLMVKRVNIKNDNSPQWYPQKAEIVGKTILFGPQLTPWRYKVLAGGDTSNLLNVDKSDWAIGYSPFGDKYFASPGNYDFPTTPQTYIPQQRTVWFESEIYVDNNGSSFFFDSYLDNGITLWVNGVKVLEDYNANAHYFSTQINSSYFKQGMNRFTIKCVDDNLGERPGNWIWFDMRLQASKGRFSEINIAHAIRELFTDDTAIGLPESSLNEDNFKKAADLFYSEGLGVSYCFVNEDCNELIDKLCYHAEAGVRENRQTGLIEIVPFRDNWFDVNTVPTFSGKDILDFTAEGINKQEATNVINVKHMDRERNQTVSYPLKNIGAIQTIGTEIPTDVSFPYYYINEPALKVANWKLKQLTTPSWKGTLVTASSKALFVNRYDVVKLVLPWYKSTLNLTVRIMSVKIGTGSNSNQTEFDWVELIPYSSALYLTPSITPPVEKSTTPKPNKNLLRELTYYEAVTTLEQRTVDEKLALYPHISYVSAYAATNQTESSYAVLYTDSGTGYEQSSTVYYTSYFKLKNNITATQTEVEVTDVIQTDSFKSGMLAWLNNEIIVIESYNEETSILTIKRGASPTIPKPHLESSEIFVQTTPAITDSSEYDEGLTIYGKVLTCTPSGVESLASSLEKSIELVGLPARPYPPANIKINNEYFPDVVKGDIILTWVHRNKYEQTGLTSLWFEDATTSPVEGLEYIVNLKDVNDNVVFTQILGNTVSTITLDPTLVQSSRLTVELYSRQPVVINNTTTVLESWGKFSHTLDKFYTAPYELEADWNNSTLSIDLKWKQDL